MTYYQFIEAVERGVKKEVEKSVSVQSYTAAKNNGTVRRGIILHEEGTNISPIIYLEEFFGQFQEGKTIKYIITEILRVYREVCFHKAWEERDVGRYDEMKERIVYRLINREANEKLLEDMPYVPYLDLAIVFYVLLEVGEFGTAAMAVYREHLELWNITEKELFERAQANTRRLLPDEFQTIGAVIEELAMQDVSITKGEEEEFMYVLSNSLRSCGAAAILYPGRLEAIGMYLKSNYYVLPSSVHEVIIISEEKALGKYTLAAIVKEMNETHVSREEVLSDHVYYYDRRKRELRM